MALEQVVSAAEQLAKVGKYFHTKGWSFATSGNYSCRTLSGILVSKSGCAKESIETKDFLLVDGQAVALEKSENRKPSDETLLHCSIYDAFSQVNCVLHTHSTYATVLGRYFEELGQISFLNYEMLKAFPGINTHSIKKSIPIYKNSQKMEDVIKPFFEDIEAHNFAHNIPAYIISGHGMYTWGISIEEAKRHVEATEFLLKSFYKEMLLRRKIDD